MTRLRRSRRIAAGLLAAAASILVEISAQEAEAPEPKPESTAPAPAPPIEWLPWSEEVFARAKAEDRGVLLTIVSPWCRPCLTADMEVYTDEIVRRLVAQRWIPVRVDRDERPDIDARYQVAVGALNRGKTGWPVTAFLFPTGEAAWADLFVPVDDREERPGMRALLVRLDRMMHTRFDLAQRNAVAVQKIFNTEKEARRPVPPAAEMFAAILGGVVQSYDYEHGGYGDPPRVTNPFAVRAALLAAHKRADDGLKEQALRSLRAPIAGALEDRIGGGFHRAARDGEWALPYFDKPLAVNAAYLRALAEAVRASGAEDLKAAAGRTIDFILGTLEAPEGGFHSAQTASSDPMDEAGYYAWRVEEVRSILGEEDLPWARTLFGFTDEGDVLLGLPPRSVLRGAAPVETAAKAAGIDAAAVRVTAGRILAKLAAARAARPAPPISEARYLDSTGVACSALIHAGAVLDRDDAVASALKAIDMVLASSPSLERGLPHRLGPAASGSPVLMADQAYFGIALLDAYEVTGEVRYLEGAKKFASALQSLFIDEAGGGFYDVMARDQAAGYLRLRRKILPDSILPSPQASAALFLDRLADFTHDETWRRGVEGAFSWTGSRAFYLDNRASTTAVALHAHGEPRVRIRIAGRGERAADLRRAAWRLYEPERIIEWAEEAKESATVCVAARCREGIIDPNDLASTVAGLRDAHRSAGDSVAAPGTLW